MSDYPQLNFTDEQDFNAAVLNAAMEVIDTRLRGLESQTVSYTDAVDQLNAFGLQRLNDAIQPVYNKLIAIAQIGVIFNAQSHTPNPLEVGRKTFVIDSARATTFAPAAYLQISSSSDGSLALYGATQSYDASTGTLVVLIDQLRGVSATPIATWNISAAGTPNLITQAHDVGAYSSVETDSAISTAVRKIVGSPPANLNTLELIASAVTGFTAGAPSNLKTFTQIATALDNRLRTDVAQGLNSGAIAQALANLGISTVMQSFLAGSGTLNSGLSVSGNLAATGNMSTSAALTVAGTITADSGNMRFGQGQGASANLWRIISGSDGRLYIQTGDGSGTPLSIGPGGDLITAQLGDLNGRIEARGQAWGQWAVNQCVISGRWVIAGQKGYNDQPGTGGFISPFGGHTMNCDYWSWRFVTADGQTGSAPFAGRWRAFQILINNQGWVTCGAAS